MLHTVQLSESAAGGGVTDPLSYVQAPTGGGLAAGGFSTVHDYANGDFRPFWFNWNMHAAHRADCRLVHQAVGLSYNIADNLENYVIGQGYTYTANPRTPGGDTQLKHTVQRDIDRITRSNSFSEVDFSDAGYELGSLESQIHNRTRRDGEDFIGIYSPTRGEIQFRLINAEHVVDPRGEESEYEKLLGYRFAQNWKYGVHTADHDIHKSLGYLVQWDTAGSDFDYFPSLSWEQAIRCRSGLMHHIKRNVDIKVKRGMSDFFPVAMDVVDDAKLIRNIRRGAQIQAAIAWIEQHMSGGQNKSSAAREVGKTKGNRKPQVVATGNSPTPDFRRHLGPGTVLNIDKNKEFKPGPMGSDRNNGFGLVAELSIRRIGLRWNMPEYMISSDASNGNRASTEVSEGPFEKARKKDQSFYCGHFRLILWKALSILVSQGFYRSFGIFKIAELVAKIGITVDAPNVSSRDQLAAAQASEILFDRGVLSKKSWQVQAELDPAQENANQSREASDTPSDPQAQDGTAGATPEPAAAVSALNGAQIVAANDILTSVSAGQTTQFVAQQLLVSLGLSPDRATEMAKSAASIASPVQQKPQGMTEQEERIASHVQLRLWDDLGVKATAYP